MNGLVVYSSVTGNTQNMALHLFEKLKNIGNWEIKNINECENIDLSKYSTIILGGWAYSSTLDKKSLTLLSKIPHTYKLGLFLSMAGNLKSEYAKKCYNNLETLLTPYPDNLGVYLTQGKGSDKLLEILKKATPDIIPLDMKKAIYEGVENYHTPTQEDYTKFIDFFKHKICK